MQFRMFRRSVEELCVRFEKSVWNQMHGLQECGLNSRRAVTLNAEELSRCVRPGDLVSQHRNTVQTRHDRAARARRRSSTGARARCARGEKRRDPASVLFSQFAMKHVSYLQSGSEAKRAAVGLDAVSGLR